MLLQTAKFHTFVWLSSISLCIYTIPSVSTHLLMDNGAFVFLIKGGNVNGTMFSSFLCPKCRSEPSVSKGITKWAKLKPDATYFKKKKKSSFTKLLIT